MVAEDALAMVEMLCAHQVVDVVLEIYLVRIKNEEKTHRPQLELCRKESRLSHSSVDFEETQREKKHKDVKVCRAPELFQYMGRPLKIRADLGGENVDIWRDMAASHSEENRPVLVGKSGTQSAYRET
ncbi:Hypothetical predicted protein [Paramuricea clavata]|uniref:Uncharacterized protein n=1 Tax=Paramuricea clavata TaxID=317549 RepID=A0A6S7FJA8_PARCT|nr:Hypothetical predicted protein [Paramuricea clavata]